MTVWYVLACNATDKYAEPARVARKYMQYSYYLGKAKPAARQSGAQFAREQLDKLGIGEDLKEIRWGTQKRPMTLPPSKLAANK